ncbi:MAG: hypothetical protein ACHQ4H_08980 [Ktedonobacterales bacterium]
MDQDRQSASSPNEHISAQQRAGEIAYLLQQARGESLADLDKVEDSHARELFGKIAGYLDVAIQALYSYQGGDEQAQRTIH